MAVFNCPQCGHLQEVDDKHLGKTATCPKCKTQSVVKSEREASPVFIPDEQPSRRVIQATAGPLGIRCDSWIDSQRHINKASSLRVGWWTIIDDTLPIRFFEPCGILAHNIANDYPLALRYAATTSVQCYDEMVAALEVRYMTFNVWGQHVATLVANEVQDLTVGHRIRYGHKWHLFSETEADVFCDSLCFISRVRLSSGTVREADLSFVLREAQRICEKVSESDLEPKAPKNA
jgi:hypothetical protein